MPWPLPSDEAGRLALAKGYPFEAPARSYLYRHGSIAAIEAADFSGRVPVIAHGSNRAPQQLERKFGRLSGADAEIPVTFGWLERHDVVYSAHVTQYGAIASNLRQVSGCRVRLAVTWLNAAQLERMHETEGRNYRYGRLSGIVLTVEAGPDAALEEAFVYLGNHGDLHDGGHPLGLAAVDAEGRPHRSAAQHEVLTLVRDRHRAGYDLDRHILETIADAALRGAIIQALRAGALPTHLPSFKAI